MTTWIRVKTYISVYERRPNKNAVQIRKMFSANIVNTNLAITYFEIGLVQLNSYFVKYVGANVYVKCLLVNMYTHSLNYLCKLQQNQ